MCRGITGILAHERCEIKLCYYFRTYTMQLEKGINAISWCSRNTGVEDPGDRYLLDNPSTFFFNVHDRIDTYDLHGHSLTPMDRLRYYSFEKPLFYKGEQTKKGEDDVRFLGVLKENSTSPASLFQLSTIYVMQNVQRWHHYNLKGIVGHNGSEVH